MSNVNKVILIGRLGKDPSSKELPSGMVCNFSVATSEKWTDKDGNKQEKTEWTNVSAFGKLAEICAKYLAKGSMAYVEGKLSTRSYEKDGTTKYVTEVIASTVQFLDKKEDKPTDGAAANDSIPW